VKKYAQSCSPTFVQSIKTIFHFLIGNLFFKKVLIGTFQTKQSHWLSGRSAFGNQAFFANSLTSGLVIQPIGKSALLS
jgi:hypothetical protein